MTAPPQINGQAPILPGGMTQVDPMLVTNSLLNAIQRAAQSAAAATSGAEAKDFMAAALSGAQAVIVLDPSLSQGGTPLQHDIAMKGIESDTQKAIAQIQGEAQIQTEHVRGANALRQAKETAAAPTPAKTKTATVRRDQHGRMQSASVTES